MNKSEAIVPDELKLVRDEIKRLKPKFYDLRKSKEDKFQKCEDYSKKIDNLYDEIKKIEEKFGLKEINETLDQKVEIKDNLEKELKEAEKLLEGFDKSKLSKPTGKKKGNFFNEKKTNEQIKRLELKLQVSVLSLSQETKINEEIQKLKNGISDKEVNDKDENLTGADLEYKQIKKNFLKLKKKLEKVNWKIRRLYKKIRLVLKEKKVSFKKIDDLRELKKNTFKEFKKDKKEYLKVLNELKKLFDKENKLMEQFGVAKKKTFQRKVRVDKKKIGNDLEESLKKGLVLTAEDLMALQG